MQEKENKRKDEEEWDRIEEMRVRKERRAEKKWRWQKVQKKIKKQYREITIQERKCFICRGCRHITCYCRNRRETEENRRVKNGGPEHWLSSNKFEVVTSRVMNIGEGSGIKEKKDRKTVLREKRLKEEKKKRLVEVRKVERGKLLREVMVKVELKQEDDEKVIIVKALLDSRVTGLVISLEFARKNKFRKKKLDRLIYMRNVDSTFNHEGPIKHIVKVELFYRGHKEITEIDVIGEQKQNVILEMSWVVCHNPEIDWKTEEVKMMRCPDECGKQWKMKQTKLEWQKEKEKEQKKEKM